MEPTASRDPDKQARIETTLEQLRKGSKSYGNIEDRIQSGTYRTNRVTLSRNRGFLEKTRARLSKKVDKGSSFQEKGYKKKIAKIGTLLSIMDDETNAENSAKPMNRIEEENGVSNTNTESETNSSAEAEVPVVASVVDTSRKFVPRTAREPVAVADPYAEMKESESLVEAVREYEDGLTTAAQTQELSPKESPFNNITSSNLESSAESNTDTNAETSTESENTPVIEAPPETTEEFQPNSNTGDESDADAEEERVEEVVAQEEDCSQFFDPCTKEPLASLEALEKRIREIKKQRDLTPIGLYGLTNNTTIYDFMKDVFVNKDISLDDMVSFKLSKERLPGTDIFEVLSHLFVFFGGIDGVNPRDGGNYKFMNRIEGGGKIYNNTRDAFNEMKCIASRGSGISDITLSLSDSTSKSLTSEAYCESECDISNNVLTKTYLMSVKWRPKREKGAKHVDLESLRTFEKEILTSEQKPSDIIVFIRSKKDFQIASNREFRQYVQFIAKTFFGWNEDVKPFLEEIRRSIFDSSIIMNKSPFEILEMQYFRPDSKPVLSLQLHQDIIVNGLCNSIDKKGDNIFLIGVLPRGGKTFIAGGIIREYLRRTSIKNLNIFWLTAAPTETMTQVRDELLDRFHDFIGFDFVEVKEVSSIKKTKEHSVFFCSSQLLIMTHKEGGKKRDFLQNLLIGKDRLSLVFFDEAHKTGTGNKTKDEIENIIKVYKNNNLPFIFLTATYYNILLDYQIQRSNTFIWDYTDVLSARALLTDTQQSDAIANLQKRFGKELVDTIIQKRLSNNETLETMAKSYVGFPDLYFISADFQDEIKERFTEQNKYRPDAGFSLSSIFAIRNNTTITDVKTSDNRIRGNAYKIFENIQNPKNVISLITPKETFDAPEIQSEPGGDPLTKEEGSLIEPSILGRINKLSMNVKSRFRLDENPTLLMFMPTGGAGTNIFYLLCAWSSLLMTHKWWRENYEIACVVSPENVTDRDMDVLIAADKPISSNGIHIISKNPKKSILSLERGLHCQEKPKGLLILAGEKLSMGISLPCTDVVFLFNEKKSPDDIIQKMYRALTPSQNKVASFVVDLNPVRTLAALYGYTRASHETLNTKSEILDIIYDTYSWDTDMFEYSLKKGADAKPLSFMDKLREMLDKAEADEDNEYRLNEDIGGIERRLGESIRRGMNSDFVQKITGQIGSKRIDAAARSIGLREGSKITIDKSGRLVIRGSVSGDNITPTSGNNETIELVIENFIETISDFVKYLAITSKSDTFEGALKEYQSNLANQDNSSLQRNILQMVRSRTDIKEGSDPELLSKLLLTAVEIFALSDSKEIFRQMKSKVDDTSIRKDKIMAIINKRLTPRAKQKKEAGEVFTPIELIDKLMSHIPKSYWKNPDTKWIDPANGIGNFPVAVFYKLDEGLKEWEPNEKKRRKHIIENMLYMVEKYSNNNRIARRIFESLCDGCKPNIITTDSTTLTQSKLKANGFPEKYDIVMGNPPFQKGRNMMFYVEFINLANVLIKENGYLIYVIPNKILIPNKANVAIKNFNPLIVYHTINKSYFPSISTTICALVCKKEKFEKDTKVVFENGEMVTNLEKPTPTQYNDINMKKVSDKIFFNKDRKYLTISKEKPTTSHIYISRVWMRYSPDRPKGGSHVFKISDEPMAGDDGSGKYILVPDGMNKSTLIWFLSRSEVMRFITKVYAGALNVPAFLWDLLPYIILKKESDSDVYRLLDLSDKDRDLIQKSLNDSIKGDEQEGDEQEGGTIYRNKTRKVRRG